MEDAKKRGLALSGGGFRATLFHLGVIRYLYDLEKAAPETKALSGITHITSVSGGSVIAAHLVLNWEKYNGTEEEFESVAQHLLSFIKKDVRGRILRRLPFKFPVYALSVFLRRTPLLDEDGTYKWARVSTTDQLQQHYSAMLFGNKKLMNLDTPSSDDPDNVKPRPLLYLLTTTLDPPGQASFTPDGFCATNPDGVFKTYDTSTHDLGLAVAASSAFPGMFTSVNFRPDPNTAPFKLIDGGVYDNLGVRKFWGLIDDQKIDIANVIVSDASVKFKPADRRTYLELLTTPLRAADILYKRVYEFETREARGNTNLGLQSETGKKEERFTFIRLQKSLPKEDKAALIPAYQQALHYTRTDLDKFSDLEIAALVRHGYSVARTKLTSTVANCLQLPANNIWNPVPNSKDPLVKEMLERDDKNAHQIKNHLEQSAVRRYRFWSHSDGMSYINVFAISVIVGALFLNPILGVLGLKTFWTEADRSAEILLQLPEKARTLRDNSRPAIDKELDAQSKHTQSNKNVDPAYLLEHMETDAKVSYALVKSGNVDSNRLATATLERGFSPEIINEAKTKGFSVPAMPALWTLAALAALHQDKNLNSERKSKIKTRIDQITKHLGNGYFDTRTIQSDGLGVRIMPKNAEQAPTSAFTTALALLVAIEMNKANLEWNNQRPNETTTHLLTWLNQNYRQNLHGWKFLDEEQGNTNEAINLQILALMLECRAQSDVNAPEEIHPKFDAIIATLEEKLLTTSDSALFDGDRLLDIGATNKLPVSSVHDEAIQPYGHMKVKLPWRPWAIRFCMLWLRNFHSSASVTPEKKRLVIDLLDKLISEFPAGDDLQAKAEILIALADLPTGRNEL